MALKALCIGINDYPGTGNDLNGCVNDANDWAAELRRRGFDVSTLLDKHATGAGIRTRIKALVESGSRGDTIVVQFSGHGSFVPDADGDEPDGTDECICPADTRNGYITDDELFDLYAARRSGVRVVMIADSCHSGTISKFAPITTPPTVTGMSAPQRKVRFMPPATFLSTRALGALGRRDGLRRASTPGRHAGLTLAGCQDAEYSYDGFFLGRPNGVFSYVALEALKSLPKAATYQQWHEAIRRKLPSRQYPQTPNLYGPEAMKKLRIFS
jgi:metacaspase-1